MSTRSITAGQPGPVTLDIVLPAGRISVRTDPRVHQAELTVRSEGLASEQDFRDVELSWDASRARLVADVPASLVQGSDSLNIVSDSFVVLGNVTGDLIISDNQVIVSGSSTAPKVEVTARVPEGTSLRVRTKSASLDAVGEFGSVEVSGVSGDVSIGGTGSLTVDTTSGAVRADIVDCEASVRTVSGKIHLGRADQVSARSTSGRITVEDFGGTADLQTVSGRISLHAAEGGTVFARSTSGSISVTATITALTEGLAVDAESRSGNVMTPKSLRATSTRPRRPRRTIEVAS
jgi:DUF4097 and DUF4098 domain-containing protein YvlB